MISIKMLQISFKSEILEEFTTSSKKTVKSIKRLWRLAICIHSSFSFICNEYMAKNITQYSNFITRAHLKCHSNSLT